MENVFFSIITINYNNGKELGRTIESVLNQPFDDYEYIIIDGGSSDDSVNIIKNIIKTHRNGNKIAFWCSEKDKGIYDAMNKGIEHSSGKYVGLINSGDFFESNIFPLIYNTIKQTNECDVYHGLLRYLNNDGNSNGIIGYTVNAFPKHMISHQACFIKNTIYEKEKYDLQYKSASDLDLIMRLYKSGCSFFMMETILANFSAGGISSSIVGAIERCKIEYRYGLITKFRYFATICAFKLKHLIFK